MTLDFSAFVQRRGVCSPPPTYFLVLITQPLSSQLYANVTWRAHSHGGGGLMGGKSARACPVSGGEEALYGLRVTTVLL